MAVDIHLLDGARLDAAFDLATKVFTEASTLHRALNIGLNEYREHLRHPFEMMVKEGLSIAATDNHSGKLIGCLIVTDFSNQIVEKANPSSRFAPLSALTNELCSQYQRKRPISVADAILVDMGAVAKDAGGRGIYKLMRAAAHGLARCRGFKLVIGELSSAVTQHVVLEQLGHRKMAEINFAEFKYGNERPFHTIQKPPSIILSEGVL